VSSIKPLKTATSEITFLDPIYKTMTFGVKTNSGIVNITSVDDTVIEIVKKSNNQRSEKSILREVSNIFKTFFEPANIRLGFSLDYNTLVSKILSISGVLKIRTKNTITGEVFEGLSFYMWNPAYPELDKQTVTNNLNLDNFELLYFNRLSLIDSKIIITHV
jgi:hypothetical protein